MNSINIFILLVLPFLLYASDNPKTDFPLHSTGSLSFDVDLFQSDGPGDSTTLEIIYAVFLADKVEQQDQQQNTTTLLIDLKISDKEGRLLVDLSERKDVLVTDSSGQSAYTTFMDIKGFNVLPDTVSLDLKIQESLNGSRGFVLQSFVMRSFDKGFSLSDLYFASHVQRAQGTGVFEKSGVMLVPNPSRLFFVNGETPKIFIYYEINNLTYHAGKPTYYEANSFIEDMAGNEVQSNSRKQIKVTSENTSRIKVIPISGFSNGIYHLTIEIFDIASGLRKEIGGYFKVDKGNANETNILPMSEAEEKKYFDQIKYIASEREKDLFNTLDARGKQEFILHFWKSKDPTPGTTENEFMIEHFRRLDVAENKYKGGISSDMGRVYIMYGPPEDIERENTMEMTGTRSIEIWVYILDGRTDFVFSDRDGDGSYTLIHSTHRDEYSNPGWRDQISGWGN